MKTTWMWAALPAALGLTACQPPETSVPPGAMAAEDALAAVDFVDEKVRAIHLDTREGPPPAYAAAIAAARDRAEAPITEMELGIALDRALASLRDAHTAILPDEEALSGYEVVPLSFEWLDEGIIAAADAGPIAKGDHVRSIGGEDEAALLAHLREIIPSENDHFLRGRAPERLLREDFLKTFDLAGGDGTVTFEVERGGQVRTVQLALGAPPSPAPAGPAVSYTIDVDRSVGLLRIDRCEYDQGYDEELAAFMGAVADNGIQRIAVDLRQNRGGNVLVAAAFLAYLEGADDYRSFGVEMRVSDDLLAAAPAFGSDGFKQLVAAFGIDPASDHYDLPGEAIKAALSAQLLTPAPDPAVRFGGDVYVLTSGRTFSSANLFASLVQDNALGTLAGEPTGNETNFHGQAVTLPIPGTSLSLSVSSTRNVRPDTGEAGEPTVTPDVPIPVTRQDIVDGTDPVLGWLDSL